jgi:hypothetical protein
MDTAAIIDSTEGVLEVARAAFSDLATAARRQKTSINNKKKKRAAADEEEYQDEPVADQDAGGDEEDENENDDDGEEDDDDGGDKSSDAAAGAAGSGRKRSTGGGDGGAVRKGRKKEAGTNLTGYHLGNIRGIPNSGHPRTKNGESYMVQARKNILKRRRQSMMKKAAETHCITAAGVLVAVLDEEGELHVYADPGTYRPLLSDPEFVAKLHRRPPGRDTLQGVLDGTFDGANSATYKLPEQCVAGGARPDVNKIKWNKLSVKKAKEAGRTGGLEDCWISYEPRTTAAAPAPAATTATVTPLASADAPAKKRKAASGPGDKPTRAVRLLANPPTPAPAAVAAAAASLASLPLPLPLPAAALAAATPLPFPLSPRLQEIENMWMQRERTNAGSESSTTSLGRKIAETQFQLAHPIDSGSLQTSNIYYWNPALRQPADFAAPLDLPVEAHVQHQHQPFLSGNSFSGAGGIALV